MTPTLQKACPETLHAITTEGQVLRGGDAAIYTLEAIGFRSLAKLLWMKPLRAIVRFGYEVIARRLGSQSCRQ